MRFSGLFSVFFRQRAINAKLDTILAQNMKISEVASNIEAAISKIRKGTDEVLAKIEELKAATTDAEVPQAVTDALERLNASAQSLDEIVPDQTKPAEGGSGDNPPPSE